jgi:hypothetical protein
VRGSGVLGVLGVSGWRLPGRLAAMSSCRAPVLLLLHRCMRFDTPRPSTLHCLGCRFELFGRQGVIDVNGPAQVADMPAGQRIVATFTEAELKWGNSFRCVARRGGCACVRVCMRACVPG